MKYPKGSEWRKWDLHIHTPKSIVQEYGGDTPEAWNEFIQKIASLPPEVKAIAITDYLFLDGYEYLLTRRNEIPNIELLFPNIEFRLNTFSGTVNNSKRHNFHLLFDPSVDVQDIKDQLLNCLSTGYLIEDKSEWNQTPTIRSLEELGRQMKLAAPEGNTINTKSDLEAGFDNITYKREDIEKLLEKSCFKGKVITAIGYSEWDQSRWDQSAAEKRTLINSCGFCLTSLNDPSKITENRKDHVTNKLNSLILHSSDAHKIDDISNTQLWIKADPTFAGLKQVLNEPNSRVFIGATPPNYKPDHKVIKQVSIQDSKKWFEDNFTIELNRDLVTLIGGRGSGKSALAEAIAYGAGSKDNTEDSFLRKASKHKDSINGTKIKLTWGDDSKTEYQVGSLSADAGLVQYLPQGAVEELCSQENSEKLQKQIENVIFQALDETERLGASDFDQLKTRVLSSFQYEKEQVVKKIKEINSKIHSLNTTLKELPEKEKLLDRNKKEQKLLIESLPKLPTAEEKGQEELSKLIDLRKKFEAKIIELQTNLGYVDNIEMKIKIFKTQIDDFSFELNPFLEALGITQKGIFEIKINDSEVKKILTEKASKISDQLKVLKEGGRQAVATILSMQIEDLSFDNLQAVNKAIEDKQKETRAFETTKLKYQQQKTTISTLDGTIIALEKEIDKIKEEAKPEKERLEKERLSQYCSYFDLLRDEQKKIEGLYKPLQASLLAGSETDKKLIFEAQINYRLDEHNKSGLEIIDRSRKGNFREIEKLKTVLNDHWDECAKETFSIPSIEGGLSKILLGFTKFEEEDISVEDQLRDEYVVEDFYNWLFDPTYFEVVSSLKFDDTDLYLLSPGQKGIILLMLYLEIDKADYRPLIIDQPEENLDNLSVYKDLIGYFRERKQYRQIIMVTHNPNLVVNTDAEQVIVANYKGKRTPRLSYVSGSLEDQAKKIPDVAIKDLDDGIIEQVCNILEGGDTAFNKRKDKYLISVKIAK